MSRKRKLFLCLAGVSFLVIVAFGTLLAMNRKSSPPLLAGLNAQIVNKEASFFSDATGKMSQMTVTTLRGVDLHQLQSRVLENQRKHPGRVSFFYTANEDTVLVEVGDVRPLDYCISYVTTLGKPPKSTSAFSIVGGSSVFVAGSGKSAYVLSAKPKKKP